MIHEFVLSKVSSVVLDLQKACETATAELDDVFGPSLDA
jgi:hypothetical protein